MVQFKVLPCLSVALLANFAVAAPLSVSSILGSITNDLSQVLSSIGITLQNVADQAGAALPYQNFCPLPVDTSVKAGKNRFKPAIKWPKGVDGGNFVDWRTFKANGVNLGGWLEKEKTHDPIWWDQYAPDAPDEWTF
ncbi:hypothetical protein LTS18_010104, partial [Coniosporium uncinatum]